MAHVTTQPQVTVGVDTHKQVHVAAARDQLGRRLAVTLTSASSGGYAGLLAWARGLGEPVAWGVEGTGSYGAGLTRFLRLHGQRVVGVNRPDRAARRRRGKSDPVDADAAARAVQAGEATGLPKAQDGVVEMLRGLRVARQTAVKARTRRSTHQGAVGYRPCPAARAAGRPVHPQAGRGGCRVGAGHADHPGGHQQAGAAQPGRALPAPGRRDHHPDRRAGPAHRHPHASAARAAGGRPGGRCCAAGHRRRQPGPAAQRGRVRGAVRRLAGGGLLGQDRPPPAQPGVGTGRPTRRCTGS
jgi:Transposase